MKNKKYALAIPVFLIFGIILFASMFGFITNASAVNCDAKCVAETNLDACNTACEALIDPDDWKTPDSPYNQCKTDCGDAWRKCWDECVALGEDGEETTEDIVAECGNDICEAEEDCSSCLADCPCNSGEMCDINDSNADANGCVVATMDLTIATDKKLYSPEEIVIINGSVSDAEGGLDSVVIAFKISGEGYSATAAITTDSSGNYSLEFPIPLESAQTTYTISATVSHSDYLSISNSTNFIVGEASIELEENAATKEPFVGLAADGASSLGILILLPQCSEGCSDVKISKLDIGKLEGDAIDATGNVTLDSTGTAEIIYYPPDYLTKDQLTKSMKVHQSDIKSWAAEVSLILTYTDASEQEGKIEAEILVFRPPVMLVHGFLGASSTWSKMSTYLRGEKFDTYSGNYSDPDRSIEGLALLLKTDIQSQIIDYAISNIMLAKVDAVGHSMGGLISRYYSHGVSDYTNDLRKLIMVGTPNHGVSWTSKTVGSIGSGWYKTHSIPGGQLYSESPFMKTLNSGEKTGNHLNPDVQHGNIYGFPDDWVVSSASAYLNGVASVLVPDVKHSPDIPVVPSVAITEYLKIWEQVKTWLNSDIYKPLLKGSRIEVSKYTGDVYLIDYDSSGSHETKLTSEPTKLDSWQSLRTNKDSTAIVHLTINEIPWGVIFLNPESEIFLGYYSPQLVEVRLWKGSAAFRSKQDGHFTVPVNITRTKDGEWWKYSPKAVFTGRNTEFAVTAGENIEVHSLEGELVIDTPNSTEEGTVLSAHESVAINGEEVTTIDPVSRDDFWWSTEDDNFLDEDSWLDKFKEGIETSTTALITFILAIVSLIFFVFFAILKFAKNKVGIGILMIVLGIISFCIFGGITLFFVIDFDDSEDVSTNSNENLNISVESNENTNTTANKNTNAKTNKNVNKTINTNKSTNTNATANKNINTAKKSSTVTVTKYGFTLEVGEDHADKIRPVSIDPGSFAESSYIFCYDTAEKNEDVIYCDLGEAPVFSVDIMTQAQWEETANSDYGSAYLSLAERNGLFYIFSHPSDTLPSDVPATEEFYNMIMDSIKFSN